MQDSKKAILSTAIVFITVIILSVSLIFPASNYTHNYDFELRNELSGSLDFLIVGASHGECALYTKKIDRILNCNSYNLSYDSMKNYEKRYLLKKELKRNNIKTVVLELSYDTLSYDNRTDYTDANIFTVMRMDSLSDRLNYFFNYVNLDNKLFVYSDWMYNSLITTKRKLLSQQDDKVDDEKADLKGSCLRNIKNYILPNNEIAKSYNQQKFSISNYIENTINEFSELIQLCHKNNARVIVAVVPVSDNYIWCNDNLDEFSKWSKEFCKKYNAEYYDFNLLKDRYLLFSDKDCYSTDTHHMSKKGAKIFSETFAKIIKQANKGKDVSKYFYKSYLQVKKDSPYMIQMMKN